MFVGAVNATISLYYYLMVIRWMYLVKPEAGQEQIGKIEVPLTGGIVLATTSVAMVLIGIVPQVIHWAEVAAAAGL